jgi:catechol 2,3-dioxygenase-like lactoylglutathione lyase family enzyme
MPLYPLTRAQEFRLKLYVQDFDKSKEFYQNLLGYPVVNEWDRGEHDKGVMFDTSAGIIEILTPEDGYIPLQGTSISLEVPDVKALWDAIKTEVVVVFEIRDNDWGDTSFAIKDPDGYKITFFTKII